MEEMNKKVVLVADDDRETRMFIRFHLEKEGFFVESAENGDIMVQKAAAIKPDILIVDFIMPGMSGYQGIKKLKEIPECANIPVLFISGMVKDPEILRAFPKEDKFFFMVKPLRGNIIIEKVRELLNLPASATPDSCESDIPQKPTESE